MNKKIEIYIATVKHDNGTVRLRVISINGKKRAKQLITAIDGCSESAIVDLVKVNIDNYKNQ